jgi:hypothetical protein
MGQSTNKVIARARGVPAALYLVKCGGDRVNGGPWRAEAGEKKKKERNANNKQNEDDGTLLRLDIDRFSMSTSVVPAKTTRNTKQPFRENNRRGREGERGDI